MIEKFRKSIPCLLPVIAILLILGMILSRVIKRDTALAEPEVTIAPHEASEYAGITAEVCGTVASADYLPQVNGKPTFLNLDEAYPNPVFTAVIFEENRKRFRNPPEEYYLNHTICVWGTVRMHEGLPQIIVSRPEQISLSDPDK